MSQSALPPQRPDGANTQFTAIMKSTALCQLVLSGPQLRTGRLCCQHATAESN